MYVVNGLAVSGPHLDCPSYQVGMSDDYEDDFEAYESDFEVWAPPFMASS